jgi:hypothetical protein
MVLKENAGFLSNIIMKRGEYKPIETHDKRKHMQRHQDAILPML